MKVTHRKTAKSHPSKAAGAVTKTSQKRTPASKFTPPAQHAPVDTTTRPAPPAQVKATARVVSTVFDGWLKVHDVEVTLSRGGIETKTIHLKVLVRPGNDSTHALTLKVHGDDPPTLVYKEGDTRPTAALRGTQYVARGIIAGSLDHTDDAEITALLEIAEEVGGTPLGKLIALGATASTMDVVDGDGDAASTEADHYYLAVLSDEQRAIEGDGGGLEVTGLMKPVERSVAESLKDLDSGVIRENARARVAAGRGLDKIGWVPALGKYVRDLPPALQKRFTTLGLGGLFDPRTATVPAPRPKEPEHPKAQGPAPKNMHLASKISDVDLGAPQSIALGNGAALLTGTINHLADDGTGKMVEVGLPVPVQTLHVDYDRAKLAQYYVDPERGPMVRLDTVERPMRAAKAAITGQPAQSVLTRDVGDLRVPLPEIRIEHGRAVGAKDLEQTAKARALELARAAVPGARVDVLSAPSYASPGQSDLGYHFMSAEVDPRAGGEFVTLAEALTACRADSMADANTEALLLRLADHLEWIPQLGMSKKEAESSL